MADNPHRCVIDADNYYVSYERLIDQSDGSVSLYAYTLQPGESLLEAPPPGGILKPRWDGAGWVETAAPEEIAAATPPPMLPEPPNPLEVLRADVDTLMIANLQMEGIL